MPIALGSAALARGSSSIPVDGNPFSLQHTHTQTIHKALAGFEPCADEQHFEQEDLERCRNLEFDCKSYSRNCRGAGRD